MGTVERTELDENFDHLAEKADKTKKWTEKIISNTEAVLEPNPSEFIVIMLMIVLSHIILINFRQQSRRLFF